MIGLIVNKKEVEELLYMLKREMDELLFDLKDDRINHIVKRGMEERYELLFSLFKRIAPPTECFMYIRKEKSNTDGNLKNNNLNVDMEL
ncbi:hypothetical protein OEV98_16730 [Caldibacillus lycopersici]|uniref:Uncharacterized protein n=1 Tax=Perspicuibacillus lycopersici TaxID=1325689 RepID=A0AAE3LNW6_9BACI|nr:hypothetical protein [Perspicuibacillus lycopersici]MCU9615175.1 hypothetical protein [Perspicuibacillus lycopersici]